MLRLDANTLVLMRGGDVLGSALSFSVGSGEGRVIKGRNGRGKTTLLRTLLGLCPPHSGSVRLCHQADPTTALSIPLHAHFVGHQTALKLNLTVEENLCFWAEFTGAPCPTTLFLDQDILGLARLWTLPVGVLSSGQRRRVALGRLKVSLRPIWILDEPTVGLDEASCKKLEAMIRTHLADGGLVIAATHLDLDIPLPVLEL